MPDSAARGDLGDGHGGTTAPNMTAVDCVLDSRYDWSHTPRDEALIEIGPRVWVVLSVTPEDAARRRAANDPVRSADGGAALPQPDRGAEPGCWRNDKVRFMGNPHPMGVFPHTHWFEWA
jgi:hypothetical protein